MDPQLREILQSSPDDAVLEAVVRLRPRQPAPAGLEIVASFGDIRTCRVRKLDLERIYAHPDVLGLKAARPVRPNESRIEPDGFRGLELHLAGRREREHYPAGEGAVVACLDWGLDYVNPAFRDRSGHTRLLALWDQRGTASSLALPYGYGTIYEREAIERSLLAPDPYAALGYRPTRRGGGKAQFHGTHCMDRAAGTPRAEATGGVAHEAELAFVHLAASGVPDLGDLGDSVRLLEGLDFVTRVAGDRPVACNASLGRTGGSHLGHSLIDDAIETWLETPGRAWCGSAGNYFGHSCHRSGLLRANEPVELSWVVPPFDTTTDELEVFLSNRDVVRLEITPPGSSDTTSVELGTERELRVGGRLVGRAYHRANDPEALHHIDVFLYPGAPAGAWSVRLVPIEILDGRIHAWVERDANAKVQSRLLSPDGQYTLGTLANGFSTLIVGAYDASTNDLGAFSSSGPTGDGRLAKPDLVAPGVREPAARASLPGEPPGRGGLITLSGTSMATPRVTGVVATIFSAVPRKLPISETRRLLLASCVPAPHLDRLRAGAGFLDEAAAIRAALEFAKRLEPVPRERGESSGITMHIDDKLRLIEAAIGTGNDLVGSHRRVTAAALGRAWSPSELINLLPHVLAAGVQVIGRAGVPPSEEPAGGDVLVRRARGNRRFDHVAVLVDPRLQTLEQLRRKGARTESSQPGLYGLVVEGGALPHRAEDGFWRRFLDLDGLVADGQLLLRSTEPRSDEGAYDSEASATGPDAERRVRANHVTCAAYPATHAVIKKIGTTDPLGALRLATGRAVELIDAAIARVDGFRDRIAKGEKTSIVDATLATALWERLRLNSGSRATWTKSGPGTVEIARRWLSNLRKILDGGELWFTCLDGSATCNDGWAWVFSHDPADGPLTPTQKFRIHLCPKFWTADENNRALTLVHEASHIYYNTRDAGGGPGIAECLSQFVGDLAGIPVHPDFVSACRSPGPAPKTSEAGDEENENEHEDFAPSPCHCHEALDPEEYEDVAGGALAFDPWLSPEDDDFSEAGGACAVVTAVSGNSLIGFEFDLNYGYTKEAVPPRTSDISLNEKDLTTHVRAVDGFKVSGDGNRIEISTKPFALDAAGKTDFETTMDKVLAYVHDMRTKCCALDVPNDLGYPKQIGIPRSFKPDKANADLKSAFPIQMTGSDVYYRDNCGVAASPQATLTLPLKRVNELVTAIRDSETEKLPGAALSGPPGFRAGVRSEALYLAQDAIDKSRKEHIKKKTKLSNGAEVTDANFTEDLRGLLLLMLSYLLTNDLATSADKESFSKAYLPLNVKNPIRLLFADLTADEKRVFTELYQKEGLFRLAKPGMTATQAAKITLFPKQANDFQKQAFGTAPTWGDFVEKTVSNTKMKLVAPSPKDGENPGCEVLWAPLSKLVPYTTGSRRVTVEMRRLGFNWVPALSFKRGGVTHPGWKEMTKKLFDLAKTLNR